MLSALLLRSSWIAAALAGAMGLVSPGGSEVPATASVPDDLVELPGTGPDSSTGTTVARAPDGLFYLTAKVNGVPIRFVVDTGANVVVLTPADARRAGVAGNAGSHALRTAGGASRMRWARLQDLRVAGQRLAPTKAAIVGGNDVPTSLLGQSALEQFGSITLRAGQLELR